MRENIQYFMSLWRAMKLVLCQIRGYAVASRSNIALCADINFMEEDAGIGYMPARVWGVPVRLCGFIGLEQKMPNACCLQAKRYRVATH